MLSFSFLHYNCCNCNTMHCLKEGMKFCTVAANIKTIAIMIVTRKVFKSLDLELFRLTRKKSADPVARSSGQACPLHANQLHLQHYNLLQFYYILQYWSTFYFILLCARWSYPLCMYVQSYMQCQIFIFQE